MAKQTRKSTAQPSVPTDPAAEIKKKITSAMLDSAISFLEKAYMLDEKTLTAAKQDDLERAGVPIGLAIRLKMLFPSETPQVSEGEEIHDDEKPTVKSAQADPRFAKELGIEPMLLAQALMGGGNMQAVFSFINIETLLGWYDPEDPDNLATNLLQQRFGSEPLIAFIPGTRDVAIKDSADYIKDRRRGFDKQEHIYVDGKLARLYPVGVLPLDFVEEDPLVVVAPGKKPAMLRRGRSTKYNADFNGIPFPTRQLVRIIVERGDANPNVRSDLKLLMSTATQGFDELSEEYPEAYLDYQEREAAGTLPPLRAQLGTSATPTLTENRQPQNQSTPPTQYSTSGGGIPWRDRA